MYQKYTSNFFHNETIENKDTIIMINEDQMLSKSLIALNWKFDAF